MNGKSANLPLDMGGFGISRYRYDHWLYKIAEREGVEVHQNTEVTGVTFQDGQFELFAHHKVYGSSLVIGAFGKRSKMDVKMKRPFMAKKSPYLGVKYHVRTDHPKPTISLHNFRNGYCGISNVENGISNLCYLSHSNNLKASGGIREMEESILFENPFLKRIFQNSDFLFPQPVTIHEISFEAKSPVDNHVMMCGDAAGMIAPLCGNGMAMAIHSSKILTDLIIPFYKGNIPDREGLESAYSKAWARQFGRRLWAGRQLQKLFGSPLASHITLGIAKNMRPLANYLISKTHGQPF
ncbi:MAG: FAD-dependent oxidoreductase [Cyclobacteriaceae bacterium]|nr:FAD-dependent oxidoreductase [Flammeovirgaceae bacterium]MCO5273261.1 FAD-dependent oxidoreductase [Cyclobacteriaceae bacterium]